MRNESIVGCIKADESQCCISDACPLFKQCFPEAYESWQKQIGKDKEGGEVLNAIKVLRRSAR